MIDCYEEIEMFDFYGTKADLMEKEITATKWESFENGNDLLIYLQEAKKAGIDLEKVTMPVMECRFEKDKTGKIRLNI